MACFQIRRWPAYPKAHRALQGAGVPTYGMLCPIFPDAMHNDGVKELVDAIRPDQCETVWAEAYNDRTNWKMVQSGYAEGSVTHTWLSLVFGEGRTELWSQYATQLYVMLLMRGEHDGWADKFKYLLYEDMITAPDATHYKGLKGLLLQNKAKNGKSPNPHLAALQQV